MGILCMKFHSTTTLIPYNDVTKQFAVQTVVNIHNSLLEHLCAACGSCAANRSTISRRSQKFKASASGEKVLHDFLCSRHSVTAISPDMQSSCHYS